MNEEIFLPELSMTYDSLNKHLISNYNIRLNNMLHKMQTGGTADSASSSDPTIGGTMASSMKHGGRLEKGDMVKSKPEFGDISGEVIDLSDIMVSVKDENGKTYMFHHSDLMPTMNKGGKIEMGDHVYIFDEKSMHKGKSGVIISELTPNTYIAKILVDGNEISAVVRKRGIKKIEQHEAGGSMTADDVFSYDTHNEEFAKGGGVSAKKIESAMKQQQENINTNSRNKTAIIKVVNDVKKHKHRLSEDKIYAVSKGYIVKSNMSGGVRVYSSDGKYIETEPKNFWSYPNANTDIHKHIATIDFKGIVHYMDKMSKGGGVYYKIDNPHEKMKTGGGVGDEKRYLIGKPEVDIVGRFNKKRYTYKTGTIKSDGSIVYGTVTFHWQGKAPKGETHWGTIITTSDFNKIIKMEKGGGIGSFFSKVKEYGKKGYEKSKSYTKEKIKKAKLKTAVDVLNDTDNKVKGKQESMYLDRARQIIINKYENGGVTSGQKRKIGKVMHEWKQGELNIGKSKKKVKSQKQAVAIALSQAGLSKKEDGGNVKEIEKKIDIAKKHMKRAEKTKNAGWKVMLDKRLKTYKKKLSK